MDAVQLTYRQEGSEEHGMSDYMRGWHDGYHGKTADLTAGPDDYRAGYADGTEDSIRCRAGLARP
jgi:hypothetical protein